MWFSFFLLSGFRWKGKLSGGLVHCGLAAAQEDTVFGVKPRHVLGQPEDAEERAAGLEQAQTFFLLRTSGISVVYVGNKGGQRS